MGGGVRQRHLRGLVHPVQRDEMILSGGVAIFAPITISLLIGAKCLGGMLVGAIASGFVLAVMMSNAGGAWDNSKKYIENENTYGGKKSKTHKACVVGDTVGDPFKDTSGPALNILIKLMSVLAPCWPPSSARTGRPGGSASSCSLGCRL